MSDQRIQYTEEMVGNGHPTKADTLNRFGNVEHDTDGTHQKAISHLTASRAVLTDGSKKLVSDEAATGTGAPVRATSPTLVTPTLGVATATSINKVTITQPATSATLTIADGKTLTVSQTVTLESGTDLYPIHEVTELCGVD